MAWSRFLGAVSLLQPNVRGNDVVVGDDGSEIATGNLSGTIRLFDAQGTMLFSMQVPSIAELESMAASPIWPVVWVGTTSSVVRIDGT